MSWVRLVLSRRQVVYKQQSSAVSELDMLIGTIRTLILQSLYFVKRRFVHGSVLGFGCCENPQENQLTHGKTCFSSLSQRSGSCLMMLF